MTHKVLDEFCTGIYGSQMIILMTFVIPLNFPPVATMRLTLLYFTCTWQSNMPENNRLIDEWRSSMSKVCFDKITSVIHLMPRQDQNKVPANSCVCVSPMSAALKYTVTDRKRVKP